MKTLLSSSLKDTEKIAKELLSSLIKKDDEATIVGLYGNLGSGKTALTKAMAKELGIKDHVTSPTFVIEKIYDTQNKDFPRLVHIDAYRLDNGEDLQKLDFEELVSNKNNLIVIEWPENIKDILPENHIKIHCTFLDENSRKFEIE